MRAGSSGRTAGAPALRRFAPRDARTAARAAAVVAVGSLVVAGATTALQPGVAAPIWAMAVPLVIISLFALASLRAPDPWSAVAACIIPLAGLVVLVGLDIASRDATLSGQLFFFLPVLYGAVLLRTPGAVVVTVLSIAGDAVVAFTLLPPTRALNDVIYMSAMLTATTALIARGADRQEALVRQLRDLTDVDQLTGLASRRALDDSLRTAVAATGDPSGLALVLIDLDHFKSINDRYGHPVGDAALRHVAGLVRSSSGPGATSARLGGDEMALLLPGCPHDTALRRAQEVADAVRTTPLLLGNGTVVRLTVSIGVAHMPSQADGVESLYRAADAALYAAKRAGRDRVGRLPEPSPPGDATGQGSPAPRPLSR